MENLEIYDFVKTVPDNAQSEIGAGRLKGKTDINPMWRIKVLTEKFGPCGLGWKYVVTNKWLEKGANDEVSAFVDIDLYVKYLGEWSDAIPGTGGSTFIAKESKGLYTSDECFKMALTDAISVACKALGVGADVYWNTEDSKYKKPAKDKPGIKYITEEQLKRFAELNITEEAACTYCKVKEIRLIPFAKANAMIQYKENKSTEKK